MSGARQRRGLGRLRRSLRQLAAAACLVALGACADRPPPLPPGVVRVAPDVVFALPKPSDLGRRLEVSQLVAGRYGERSFLFEGHINAEPGRILLVGLDGFGRRILEVTWTDSSLAAETARGFPEQIRAENILADIVLLYWPAESVNRALAGSSAHLEVGPRTRRVVREGKDVIQMQYGGDDPWRGTAVYRNLAWGYELNIQSVEGRP